MHEWKEAGEEGGRIRDRIDAGEDRCRRGEMDESREAGQERCRTGWM